MARDVLALWIKTFCLMELSEIGVDTSIRGMSDELNGQLD
jgi:hypothetical protein